MKSFILIFASFATTTVFAQQPPQLCSQIDSYSACMTAARGRVDKCSNNVVSVPTVTYYECLCTELTSIQSCYSYCPEDPQLQSQLISEQANAKGSCDTSQQMRRIENTKASTSAANAAAASSVAAASAASRSSVASAATPVAPVATTAAPRPTIAGQGQMPLQPVSSSTIATSTTKRPGPTSTINLANSGESSVCKGYFASNITLALLVFLLFSL